MLTFYSKLHLFILIVGCLLWSPSLKPVLADTSTDSLVGYWKLDETSSGGSNSVIDSSGDGNNGTPGGAAGANNKPQPSSSVPSISFSDLRSLSFDGTDDEVNAGSASTLDNLTGLTVSAWINPTSVGENNVGMIVNKTTANGPSNGWILFTTTTNLVGFAVDYSTTNLERDTPNNSLTIGSWNHVLATWDGSSSASNLHIYINGTEVSSYSISSNGSGSRNSDALAALRIGNSPAGDRTFDGLIDDVRVYNRVLSATEISALGSGNHTSASWTGTSSTNPETAGNWSISAIPDPYTNITIADVTNDPVATANLSLASLTLNTGGDLSMAGFNLTFNDSGTFTNNGTLRLQGAETLSGFSNDTDSGTIIYSGSGTYSSGLIAGNTYNNLTFNGSGSWTLSSLLDVNGNLAIASGTLASGGNNITLGGNWSNSGTYTAGGSTVTLDGTNQTISGSSTFYNLTKSVSTAETLTFTAGTTQTITNTLTLNGASSNLLSLRSSSDGSQWNINPQGTRNITYIDVKDSNNINSTAIAYSATNTYRTNLTNWTTSGSSSVSSSSPQVNGVSTSTDPPSCNDTPPGVPNLFQIDTAGTYVNLYFEKASGSLTGYSVSYGLNEAANQYGDNFDYNQPDWIIGRTISGLSPNTVYYFKVKAVNGCNGSEWSKVLTIKTKSRFANITQFFSNLNPFKSITPNSSAPTNEAVTKNCEYTIEEGDSLWSIALSVLGSGARYGEIISLNPELSEKNILTINQKILTCSD